MTRNPDDITWLDESNFDFPPVDYALTEPEGLLAVGGDLHWKRLVNAYREGIFPWYSEQPILWWSPDPRCVLFPEQIKISRSLHQALKRQDFTVTADEAFERVINECANIDNRTSSEEEIDSQDGTWITQDMIDAYIHLHEHGLAHSIEVWRDDELVGGLYGVNTGTIFSGESMFSKHASASKIALVYLANQLKQWDYALIDCQVPNPYLHSMGAVNIPRAEYLQVLNKARDEKPVVKWSIDWKYCDN